MLLKEYRNSAGYEIEQQAHIQNGEQLSSELCSAEVLTRVVVPFNETDCASAQG